MAIAPSYINTSKIDFAAISTANALYNGTGSITDIFTAPEKGYYLSKIRVQSTGTVTAGAVNLFLNFGTGYIFFRQIPVTAGSQISVETIFDLPIPRGVKLAASTVNAEEFNIFAIGGEF